MSKEIDTIVHEREVGQYYKDAWDDDIRVNLYSKEEQRFYSKEAFDKLLQRRGWEVVSGEQSHSGSKFRIINKSVEKKCQKCETNAFYDSGKSEWYCPRCEM